MCTKSKSHHEPRPNAIFFATLYPHIYTQAFCQQVAITLEKTELIGYYLAHLAAKFLQKGFVDTINDSRPDIIAPETYTQKNTQAINSSE